MIMTNKLLPVALIAALVGGSGAHWLCTRVNRLRLRPKVASAQETAQTTPTAEPVSDNEMVPANFNTAGEQTAYKTGFADGFAAAAQAEQRTVTTTERAPTRVVYRNSGSRTSASNRVYYDYQPRKRSFWDKHRDKLTVAIGTGGAASAD